MGGGEAFIARNDLASSRWIPFDLLGHGALHQGHGKRWPRGLGEGYALRRRAAQPEPGPNPK